MNGVIYCRVSSKEQIQGTSLESQEAACREYARSKDIQVLRAFIEQGESAKFADRTQLLELIDFCRGNKGSVQVLLVWKVDRFARNVADHFSVKATLAKYGVRIMSVTEPIDTNPEGKLMETILAGFAQFDNDIRAMRTVQGMRRKLQEGIFPWGPPLGYKSSVANHEKKTLPDLPDPTVFELLQKAWKEFATGAYTQSEMGRLMQTWGLASAHGRAFSPQSLYQLFTNPYYAGILNDPWTGEEHEGKHVAMITREEFGRVQRAIAGRNRSIAHQKDHPELPMRGVVRCDSCLHYLTGGISRGRSRGYAYYNCRFKPCPKYGKSYPISQAHDEFAGFLDRVAPKREVLERLGDIIVAQSEHRQSESEVTNRRRRERGSGLDRELDELIRMRAQGLITDEEFLRQKKTIVDQRAAFESTNRRIVNAQHIRKHLSEIIDPLTNLRATWNSLKPLPRRRFDRLLLPAGFVNGKIRTAQLGLLFSTTVASGSEDSSVVPLAGEDSNPIITEIQECWNILNSIEEPERVPKRRFENSHRNRLRWSNSNQQSSAA
jgi:site-specific DNA recombinase